MADTSPMVLSTIDKILSQVESACDQAEHVQYADDGVDYVEDHQFDARRLCAETSAHGESARSWRLVVCEERERCCCCLFLCLCGAAAYAVAGCVRGGKAVLLLFIFVSIKS